MIRLGGRPVRGFALGDDGSVDDLVAAKLAEGGYADVSAYQAAKGLAVDGVAGHDTLTAMGLGYLFDLAGRGMLSAGQTQLETKNTPLTPEQAAEALSAAYQAVAGNVPTSDVLALLLAQSGHETADWQKLPNYAFGGVKATSGTPYVQAFVTPEGDPPKHYVLAFAAYPSAEAGAEAYVRTLEARAPWWQGLHSGVPETFVDALRSIPGALYFTGNQDDYLASLRARVDRFSDLAKSYARQLPTAAIDVVTRMTAPVVTRVRQATARMVRPSSKTTTAVVVGTMVLTAAAAYAISRIHLSQ